MNAVRLMSPNRRRNMGGFCKSWGPRGEAWYSTPPTVRCVADVQELAGYVGGTALQRCGDRWPASVCVERVLVLPGRIESISTTVRVFR
jgi:hypothetical protein